MSADDGTATRLAALEAAIVTCTRCPELRAYTAEVARTKRRAHRDDAYWGRPVPAFGAADARVALVGLAPGAHGSNRTGRMFTGDASGVWLYRALHRAGFANQAFQRDADDGLVLVDTFVTAALRCAPPGNAPTPAQRRACAPHLDAELALLTDLRVVVGLGAIGTRAAVDALRRLGHVVPRVRFAHGASVRTERPDARGVTLVASYHPSRQNTNTGVLTEAMFDEIFTRVRHLLG